MLMKQKNYDEGVPGIVGSVLQIMGGQMIVRGDFYRDKSNNKNQLNGKMFVVNDLPGIDVCFVGDLVRIEKTGVINITQKMTTCNFVSMLSKREVELLEQQKAEFMFNGFIEQVNINEKSAVMRFHVTSRINADGIKLRVDKLVNYQTSGVSVNLDNNFLNTLFSAPPKQSLTVKFGRRYDKDAKKLVDVVSLMGITPLQNARTFLKKNC